MSCRGTPFNELDDFLRWPNLDGSSDVIWCGQGLTIISGPPCVGKSTLIAALVAQGVAESIPRITTRPRRRGEDDRELEFVTEGEFQRLDRAGELVFTERYAGTGAHYAYRRTKLFVQPTVPVPLLAVGSLRAHLSIAGSRYVYMYPSSVELLRRRMVDSGRHDVDSTLAYARMEVSAFDRFWTNNPPKTVGKLCLGEGDLCSSASALMGSIAQRCPPRNQ